MEKMSIYCGEKLLKDMEDNLSHMLKEADPLDEGYQELLDSYELCHRVNHYPYFDESVERSDACCEAFSKGNLEEFEKLDKEWSALYRKNRKKKVGDMKKLFTLIAENIEDWC